MAVEATLAGRAYQQVQVRTHELPGGQVRVWLPLLDRSERLGVLSVVAGREAMAHPQLLVRLRRFARFRPPGGASLYRPALGTRR